MTNDDDDDDWRSMFEAHSDTVNVCRCMCVCVCVCALTDDQSMVDQSRQTGRLLSISLL